VLAPVFTLTPTELGLDNERTTVNGVDDSVARIKSEVRPGARVPDSRATTRKIVVLRVDVEESNLLDLAAVGVLGNGAYVENTETSLVVGLVGETLVDELIVVDGAGGGLVVARVLGMLQVGDVPDVSDWEAILGGRIGCGAVRVNLALVKLVVHDKVSLPHRVYDPALMGIRGTDVRSAGDNLSSFGSVLVGDVVDGERIFVIAIAYISSEISGIRAAVDYALRIVYIAIISIASGRIGLVRIVQVDEDEATGAGVVPSGATTAADGDSVAKLLVSDDIVRATRNAIGKVHPANVLLDIEGLGLFGAQLEQFLHVEKLDAVTNALRPYDQSVPDLLHLTPNDTVVGGR
jgi:hypothetical protein